MAKEKKNKAKNEDFSIPDSAMVMPSSMDDTQRTRQMGMADPADKKSGGKKKK